MRNMIKDTRNAAASFTSGYLLLILPASILLTLLLFGASILKVASTTQIFAIAGVLYASLPALIVTKRGDLSRAARIKAWIMAAGDALLIGALIYFFPWPDYTTPMGAIALSSAIGLFFLALCVLTLRGLRLATRSDRGSLIADFKLVWKISHVLLILFCIGLICPVAISGLLVSLQTSGLLQDAAIQQLIGLATSGFIIIPASFMPFILLAEGLKRAGLDDTSTKVETNTKG